MTQMIFITLLVSIVHFAGCSQQPEKKMNPSKTATRIGGSCEGCEAIYESPIPFTKLSWVDTLPDYNEAGPKLHIEGIVFIKMEKPRQRT